MGVDVEQPLLIHEMMQRLGIERAARVLPQYALRYAVAHRNCQACETRAACLKWLDAHEVATFAPVFCRNSDALFELQYDQHVLR